MKYISSLQSEPTDEKVKIDYLEAIEHLEHAEYVTLALIDHTITLSFYLEQWHATGYLNSQ